VAADGRRWGVGAFDVHEVHDQEQWRITVSVDSRVALVEDAGRLVCLLLGGAKAEGGEGGFPRSRS
jgi:hypothetical protein